MVANRPCGRPHLGSSWKSRAALLLLACLLCLSDRTGRAQDPESPPQPSNPASLDLRPGYAGDAVCAKCHNIQAAGYQHTGHKLTSQLPTPSTVLGNFHPGANVLTISDPKTNPALPALYFKMEEKNGVFTETAVTGWPGEQETRSEKIELVTGSGKRGQTYLYWQGDKLYELPVSYWTDGHRWVNSPGFNDGTADFSRPINPGCMECHSTFIQALSTDVATNSYLKETLVPGLSCETCHGPGAAHAAATANSTPAGPDSSAGTILNPKTFARDRQVDLCAYCHSGIQREELTPAFSYLPGKPLTDYFKPLPAPPVDRPDVHGNQVGLLQRSRCYLSSPQMSCSTCHDVHEVEKPAASYSAKCLGCHQWQSCGVAKRLGPSIAKNCIDCHMPIEETNVIVSETAGHVVKAKMRNHWIKVYNQVHTP